jgi:2-dehydropantoate 2-reductase
MIPVPYHGVRIWTWMSRTRGTAQSVKGFRHSTTSHSKMATNNRIHILGVGNLGRLFAHSLATKFNPPPITLLLHRETLFSEWEQAGRKVDITTNGKPSSATNIDVEVLELGSAPDPISNLIVTTKTINTVKAIDCIKDRLNGDSTILFAQNGMGTTDQVTSLVFPDPSTRPQYLAGITSHGVYSTGPFSSVHAGFAHVSLGPVSSPSSPFTGLNPQSQYLIDQVTRAKVLNAKEVSAQELTILQLQKLVINAMMNPLTVIFDCKNGELFTRGAIVQTMRQLLAEASHVLLSLPELRSASSDEDINSLFSTQTLEELVLDVAEKTAANTSSMLQDVRAGRETEIDYINGYIVRRGKELGVDVGNNERLVRMVKDGKRIGVDEVEEYLPRYNGADKGWLAQMLSII